MRDISDNDFLNGVRKNHYSLDVISSTDGYCAMNAILMLTKDAHKIVEELEAAWLYNTSRFTECPLVGISGTHLERWCNLLGIQLFHD